MTLIILKIVITIIVLIFSFHLIGKIIKGGRASPFQNTSLADPPPADFGDLGLSYSLGLRLKNPLPLLSKVGEAFLNTNLNKNKHKYLLQTIIVNFEPARIISDPLGYIIWCNGGDGGREGTFLDVNQTMLDEIGDFRGYFDFENVVDNLTIRDDGIKRRIKYLYNQLLELLMNDINIDFAEFVGQLSRKIDINECGAQTYTTFKLPETLPLESSLRIDIDNPVRLSTNTPIINQQEAAKRTKEASESKDDDVPKSKGKSKGKGKSKDDVPKSKPWRGNGTRGEKSEIVPKTRREPKKGGKLRGSGPTGEEAAEEVCLEEEDGEDAVELERIKNLCRNWRENKEITEGVDLKEMEIQISRDSNTADFVKYSYSPSATAQSRSAVISPNYNFLKKGFGESAEFVKIAYVPIKEAIRDWYTRNDQYLDVFCGYASYDDAIQYDNTFEDKTHSYVFSNSNSVKAFEFADIYPAQKASMMVLYLYLYFGLNDDIPNLPELIAVFALYVHKFNQFCSVVMERNWNGIILNEFVYVKNNNVQYKEMIPVPNDTGGGNTQENISTKTRSPRATPSDPFDNINFEIRYFSTQLKTYPHDKQVRFLEKIEEIRKKVDNINKKISIFVFNKEKVHTEYDITFDFSVKPYVKNIVEKVKDNVSAISEKKMELLNKVPISLSDEMNIRRDAEGVLDSIIVLRLKKDDPDYCPEEVRSPYEYKNYLGYDDDYTKDYEAAWELLQELDSRSRDISEKRKEIERNEEKKLKELDEVVNREYGRFFVTYGITHPQASPITFNVCGIPSMLKNFEAGIEFLKKNGRQEDDENIKFSLLGNKSTLENIVCLREDDFTARTTIYANGFYSVSCYTCAEFQRDYLVFEFKNIMKSDDQKEIVSLLKTLASLDNQYICSYKCIDMQMLHNSVLLINTLDFKYCSTLQDVITSGFKGWDLPDRLNCIYSIVCGLKYLNGKYAYHGHLCPINILVDECKQCYLCNPMIYHLLVNIKPDITPDVNLDQLEYMDPNITGKYHYLSSNMRKVDLYSFGVLFKKILGDFEIFNRVFEETVVEIPGDVNDINYLYNKVGEIFSARTKVDGKILESFETFLSINRLEVLADKRNNNALIKLGLTAEDNSSKAEYFGKLATAQHPLGEALYASLIMARSLENSEEYKDLLNLSSSSGNIAGIFYHGVYLHKLREDEKGRTEGFEEISSAAGKMFLPATRYYAYEFTKEFIKEFTKEFTEEFTKECAKEFTKYCTTAFSNVEKKGFNSMFLIQTDDLFVLIQYMVCKGFMDFDPEMPANDLLDNYGCFEEKMPVERYSRIALDSFIDLLEDDKYIALLNVLSKIDHSKYYEKRGKKNLRSPSSLPPSKTRDPTPSIPQIELVPPVSVPSFKSKVNCLPSSSPPPQPGFTATQSTFPPQPSVPPFVPQQIPIYSSFQTSGKSGGKFYLRNLIVEMNEELFSYKEYNNGSVEIFAIDGRQIINFPFTKIKIKLNESLFLIESDNVLYKKLESDKDGIKNIILRDGKGNKAWDIFRK